MENANPTKPTNRDEAKDVIQGLLSDPNPKLCRGADNPSTILSKYCMKVTQDAETFMDTFPGCSEEDWERPMNIVEFATHAPEEAVLDLAESILACGDPRDPDVFFAKFWGTVKEVAPPASPSPAPAPAPAPKEAPAPVAPPVSPAPVPKAKPGKTPTQVDLTKVLVEAILPYLPKGGPSANEEDEKYGGKTAHERMSEFVEGVKAGFARRDAKIATLETQIQTLVTEMETLKSRAAPAQEGEALDF